MAELDLIRNSSSYIYDKHPELVQLIKEQESCFSPKTITEDIDHNISAALEFGKLGEKSQDPEGIIFEPMLTLFDFGILQIFELTCIFMRHSDKKPAISWNFKHKHASVPEPTYFFFVALTHIYNTLRSIRMLLQKGFDAQARVLARSYIETAEVLLAASGSSIVFNQFIDYPQEDEPDRPTFWFKYLSPKQIRKKILRLLEEKELDRGLVEDFNRLLQNTYQMLSESTHPTWHGMVFGSYAMHSKSNVVFEVNLGGNQSDLSQGTIVLIVDHIFIFLVILIHLLWKKHQWRLLRSDIENLRFLYQQKVFQHLFLSLRPDINSLLDDTAGILGTD